VDKKTINPSIANQPFFSGLICIGIASILSLVFTALLGIVDLANIVMIFLLSTFLIAISLGRNAAIFSAFINVGFFDFFFVTPRFSFSVDDSQYLITFLVMLIVGLVTGHLAARLKEQIQDVSAREKLAKALQGLSQGLFNAKTDDQIIQVAKSVLEGPIGIEIDLFITETPETLRTTKFDMQSALWSMQSGTRIFHEIDEMNGKSIIYLPIRSELKTLGILVASDPTKSLRHHGRDDLLQTAANLIALAVVQLRSTQAQELSKIEAAAERLKSAILSSLSHDLRTPLTTMIGLAESLQERNQGIDAESKADLDTIRSQGLRLSSMIGNLLEMARLQTQGPTLKKEWQPIEDVIGASIKHFSTSFPKNPVKVDIANDVPPLLFDEVLIERVLCNLLENAAKYSSESATIQVLAKRDEQFVEVSVIDAGAGFAQDPSQLFEMFARGVSDTNKSGMGLGLAICREIVEAHGGSITARNNEAQGGSAITFTLPITENTGLPKL
jgi:two-component system, OmpR family, sensor histidine kinase KdpD